MADGVTRPPGSLVTSVGSDGAVVSHESDVGPTPHLRVACGVGGGGEPVAPTGPRSEEAQTVVLKRKTSSSGPRLLRLRVSDHTMYTEPLAPAAMLE